MNVTRRLLISFEPAFDNVDMARAAVRGVCTDFFQLADSAESITDFCLIVTELMNNAVEHSNTQVIEVELILFDHEAVFRLISEGIGFDPTPAAAMPCPEQDEELPDSGYGLAIIQALADGMLYVCRENRNRVTLRKTFTVNTGGRSADMEVKLEMDNEVIILKLIGDLVASSAEELKTQVAKLMEKRYRFILLDLERVNFIDSSGLGACIAIKRDLAAKNGLLACSGLKENVRKVFRITRADQKILIFDARQDAMGALMERMSKSLG